MAPDDIDVIRARLAAHPRPADLAERRARIDGLGAGYALPSDVVVEPADADGVTAEWTRTPAAEGDAVILFLHGGGYVSGSLTSHRHMVAQAGRAARARTFALDYRLAPEHPFPAALEDALAGYRFLLASGIAPARIALAGESAGGGLALTGASMDAKAAVDPLLSRAYLSELAGLYLNGADARGPLVSPLGADLAGLPPMLIQVGSAETLLDDSVRLAAVAGAADVAVQLEIWPHMIHAWHLFYPEVADGRHSLASAGAFVARRLGAR